MSLSLPDYAIEAEGLYKTYAATKTTPAKTALNGIDLKIPRGSIFGLLGPNGAGKSTFINTLSGLVRKTAGTVKIWGMDIDAHPRTPAPPSAWWRRRSSPTSSSPRASRWRPRPACSACRPTSAAPPSCWPPWA